MKVPYYLAKFLSEGENEYLNIVVMFIACMNKISAAVYINNRTENNRRVLHLNFCTLSLEIYDAVIGLHVISENDYVSVFFLKGKKNSSGLYART